MSMATIQVIGRLGADAEDKGDFLAFRIAETVKIKGVEQTTWYSCSTPNKAIAGFLKQGKPILVRGYHSIPRDDDGMPRLNSAGTDVLQNIARAEVEFLPMPKQEGETQARSDSQDAPAPPASSAQGTPGGVSAASGTERKKPFFSKKKTEG